MGYYKVFKNWLINTLISIGNNQVNGEKPMMDIVTQQLDAGDIKRANLISGIGGLSILEGKIITALIEKKTLDTAGLVGICASVQPQVSISTLTLIEKGFIMVETAPLEANKRGRAKNLYKLKASVKELIKTLETGYRERLVEMETDIKKLKEIS